MLKIGVIGYGACGNQIVSLAANEGFECLAVNTTSIDLDGIKSDKFNYVIIGSEGGTGKDRNIAKELIKERYSEIVRDVFRMFSDFDLIVNVGSSGGGTASGMMPIMTKVLTKAMPDHKFMNMVIMPSEFESARAQFNSIDYWSEIKQLDVSILPLDNGKVKSTDISVVFKTINQYAVECLKVFRGDYTSVSSEFGIIDDKDMLKLASTKGVITLSKLSNIRENDLDKSSLSEFIIDSIKNNYCVDFDRTKIVKRMGFIMSLPKAISAKRDSSYSMNIDYVGQPIDIFEHIVLTGAENPGHIISIMSGLSYPENRLSQMAAMIESKKEMLLATKESNIDSIKSTVDFMQNDNSIQAMRKKTDKKLNIEIGADAIEI